MYKCGSCKAELAPERTLRVEGATEPGHILVRYVCECRPGKDLTGLYRFSGVVMEELTGGYSIPWNSPLPRRIVTDDDPEMAYWRWELEQIKDSEEFIWWLENSR